MEGFREVTTGGAAEAAGLVADPTTHTMTAAGSGLQGAVRARRMIRRICISTYPHLSPRRFDLVFSRSCVGRDHPSLTARRKPVARAGVL